MFVSLAEPVYPAKASQPRVDKLSARLEALPPAKLSSANLAKRLYLASLIKRAVSPSIKDKPILSNSILLKAEDALDALEQSLQQQQEQAKKQIAIIEEDYAYLFEKAQSLLETCSYSELTLLFNSVQRSKSPYSSKTGCFKELIKEMSSFEPSGAVSTEKVSNKTKQAELQSFQQYQAMFEKMALDRLLSKVMKEIPENAGPLNPERLVIRSFKALQDISPDYLSHLISYYESLLTLKLLNNTDK